MTIDHDNNTNNEIGSMIADYMEKGFLENIIDMFKHDASLYGLIGKLIQDERLHVRVGITALMEEMKKGGDMNMLKALPELLPLLQHNNPVVRGDAANLMGIISDRNAAPFLKKLLADENLDVRTIAEEAIEEINSNLGQ